MAVFRSGQQPSQLLWWRRDEPGRAMVDTAKAIEESNDHRARRRQNLRHMRLYCNRDLSSIYQAGVAVDTYDAGVWLTMNVVQSCVDTVASKLWKTPRIQASVQDGDWSLKQRAKKLSRFADGLWHAQKWASKSRQMGIDATLFGSGYVHVFADRTGDEDGEVVIERVLPDELIYDETEAINGLDSLRCLYRKKWVHRELLLEQWLDKADKKNREHVRDAIDNAPGANPREYYTSSAAEMVAVYEGWHLPSRHGSDDGTHIIAIEGTSEYATLFKGPWKRRRFPIVGMPWNKLPVGFSGRSLAEELVPIQIRLNEILETLTAGQNMMCVPKIFAKKGSLDMDTWTNAFAELIQTNGDPGSSIQVVTPPGVSPELYKERDFWWQFAFEQTGISMLSATAEKPEGIGSAVALRELLDREDMRLTPKGKQWEEANVEVFEAAVDAMDELMEEGRKVTVQVPREKFVQSISWSGKDGVDLERDKYILKADAVSSLPSTPQGRKQYAVELWQLGAVNREQFLQMLELPDTTSTMNLILASIELAERAMEIMVEQGRYEAPEEYSDLVLARTIAMQTYLRERMDGAPDKVLLLLLRYVQECTELMEADAPAQADAQRAQAQMAGAEGAPGMAAPAPVQPAPVPVPQPMPAAPPVEMPMQTGPAPELLPAPETMMVPAGEAVAPVVG